jgi:hypothetical protein
MFTHKIWWRKEIWRVLRKKTKVIVSWNLFRITKQMYFSHMPQKNIISSQNFVFQHRMYRCNPNMCTNNQKLSSEYYTSVPRALHARVANTPRSLNRSQGSTSWTSMHGKLFINLTACSNQLHHRRNQSTVKDQVMVATCAAVYVFRGEGRGRGKPWVVRGEL